MAQSRQTLSITPTDLKTLIEFYKQNKSFTNKFFTPKSIKKLKNIYKPHKNSLHEPLTKKELFALVELLLTDESTPNTAAYHTIAQLKNRFEECHLPLRYFKELKDIGHYNEETINKLYECSNPQYAISIVKTYKLLYAIRINATDNDVVKLAEHFPQLEKLSFCCGLNQTIFNILSSILQTYGSEETKNNRIEKYLATFISIKKHNDYHELVQSKFIEFLLHDTNNANIDLFWKVYLLLRTNKQASVSSICYIIKQLATQLISYLENYKHSKKNVLNNLNAIEKSLRYLDESDAIYFHSYILNKPQLTQSAKFKRVYNYFRDTLVTTEGDRCHKPIDDIFNLHFTEEALGLLVTFIDKGWMGIAKLDTLKPFFDLHKDSNNKVLQYTIEDNLGTKNTKLDTLKKLIILATNVNEYLINQQLTTATKHNPSFFSNDLTSTSPFKPPRSRLNVVHNPKKTAANLTATTDLVSQQAESKTPLMFFNKFKLPAFIKSNLDPKTINKLSFQH